MALDCRRRSSSSRLVRTKRRNIPTPEIVTTDPKWLRWSSLVLLHRLSRRSTVVKSLCAQTSVKVTSFDTITGHFATRHTTKPAFSTNSISLDCRHWNRSWVIKGGYGSCSAYYIAWPWPGSIHSPTRPTNRPGKWPSCSPNVAGTCEAYSLSAVNSNQ